MTEKRELFQIGEVARIFHISVGTLRHYEKLGLLQPEYTDAATGYRYYSTRQFECLNTIRYLRALDMPLPQIADFLQNRDVDKMQQMLCQQREAVVNKRRELELVERKIDNRLRRLADAHALAFDTVQLVQAKACRLAWLRNDISINTYLDLEKPIQQLVQQQETPVVFLGKVGVGISAERMLRGQFDRYNMVFLLLDEEDTYQGETERIPAGTCAAVYFCGEHRAAPRYYRALTEYIKQNGLRIAGFSREITLIDYGLTNDTSQFVTEILVPVERS